MKRFICCSTILLVTSLLCLGQSYREKQINSIINKAFSDTTHKYDFKPCYRPVVKSEGDYDLSGKKYYIAEIQYDSLSTEISESRIEAFRNHVNQSLSLRGAVEVENEQDADFTVFASVRFWDGNADTDFSRPSRGFVRQSPRGSLGSTFEAYDWSPTSVNLSRRNEGAYRHAEAPRRPNYRDPGISKTTVHWQSYHKAIVIDALDKDEKALFRSTVHCDNRAMGFRALIPNDVMLFLLADSYGNTARYGFNLDVYNGYLALFKKGELAGNSNITYAPNSTPSSNKLGIFLVDRQPDKTVVVVRDEGKLKLDQSKRKTAMLKVGDNLLPCSNMSYSAPKIAQGVRFLTLEFPTIGEESEFDLLFCKKNKPEKVKASVNNIIL